MKEWALENGATHFTHVFQPLTGLTAEKHDSFFDPTGDGTALAEFSGEELIQGEPDASSFPTGGIRATFEARGYTAWDPTSPAFLLDNPNGTLLCIPTAFASWTGEALDAKIPLLRSMDALSRSAIRALQLLGDEESQRVFTTVGPEQEYFLIDEQYFFERPDLVTTGRTLFGAKPAKGHELDDHYFGSIPERVLAFMMETELELAKLGVPVKTRHNEVAPGQYEIAPVFENSNVGSDHQQLTMQVMQSIGPQVRPGLPAAREALRGRERLGQAQQLVDGHRHRPQPAWIRATRRGEHELPVLLRGGDPGREQAPGPAAGLGRQHRPGPPAGSQRGAAGDHLDLPGRRAGQGVRGDRVGRPGPRTRPTSHGPGHAGAAGAAHARRRPQPHVAVRVHRQQVRVPRAGVQHVAGLPQHRAEHDRRRGHRRARGQARGRARRRTKLPEAVQAVVKESYAANKQVFFGGDNYAEEWHAEAEQRGLKNLRTTPDALPEVLADQTVAAFEKYDVLSQRELESRLEVWTEQYVIKANIEAETTSTIARTLLLPAALRHLELVDAAGFEDLRGDQGQIEAFVAAIGRARAGQRLPRRHRGDLRSWRSTPATSS